MAQSPFDPDALSRSVPRYTSYPTAPHFTEAVDSKTYARWLGEMDPSAPISLYLHIPFCDQLCWFCACRTQGSRRYAPVARYLEQIEREIEAVAKIAGWAPPVTQVHWGGGSPTVLTAADMARLAKHLRLCFPGAESAEFAVEIDPRDMTPDRVRALGEFGLTRASIGVQDFDPTVQQAIGRLQSYQLTRDTVTDLRTIGVTGVNMDLLYGLPNQSEASLSRTIRQVVDIGPDRIALFGYAHVPWMAPRQKLIPEDVLPCPAARRDQAAMAAEMLTLAGYTAIGIDHFAKPGDALALARDTGHLRRNFQGYTVDQAEVLLAFGTSAIGRFPQGYVQNETSTPAYQARIDSGTLATRRGISLNLEDRARAAAIEQILCQFRLETEPLTARYGDFAQPVMRTAMRLLGNAPDGALAPIGGGFEITPIWRDHARLIAAEFDTYFQTAPARHSIAL